MIISWKTRCGFLYKLLVYSVEKERVNMNYEKHNEEVRRLLQQAEEGKCERVMMELAMNPRMIISDPMLNPRRSTFEE